MARPPWTPEGVELKVLSLSKEELLARSSYISENLSSYCIPNAEFHCYVEACFNSQDCLGICTDNRESFSFDLEEIARFAHLEPARFTESIAHMTSKATELLHPKKDESDYVLTQFGFFPPQGPGLGCIAAKSKKISFLIWENGTFVSNLNDHDDLPESIFLVALWIVTLLDPDRIHEKICCLCHTDDDCFCTSIQRV